MNQKSTIIKIFLTLILVSFAKILWMLPFQLFLPDIYKDYLTFKNYTFWLIIIWFFYGAYKIVSIELNNPKSSVGLLKKCIMVPFVAFMNLGQISKDDNAPNQ